MRVSIVLKLLIGLASLLPLSLMAAEYDSLLLKAQASIFPKVVMLDRAVASKTVDSIIKINIVYRDRDQGTAEKMKDFIEAKYRSKLGSYALDVSITPYNAVQNNMFATAYIALHGSESEVSQLSSWAGSQQRLVMSYDSQGFASNTLISVLLKEKTYIYLNKPALDTYQIKFLPLFYKIVKVYK
ncbi:MAG: hypothetical protein U9N57_11695 [Pseudomonadota bacterium]|nr:hypothetical protein [Pseudomonadota bacterium]